MDVDLWDCFGRKKTMSYNQRNMVLIIQKQMLIPVNTEASAKTAGTYRMIRAFWLDYLHIMKGRFSHGLIAPKRKDDNSQKERVHQGCQGSMKE